MPAGVQVEMLRWIATGIYMYMQHDIVGFKVIRGEFLFKGL
jgi:hypothetical protein